MTVLRSIHSSGKLITALRGPTTCSDPVSIMHWELSYSCASGCGICEAARSTDRNFFTLPTREMKV